MIPDTKPPRIVAVDLMRIMAALLVMCAHLGYVEVYKQAYLQGGLNFLELCIPRVSPVFFLLAGYFACRNITWKKACYNAWWCLAPFVLWNSITLTIAAWAEPDFPWNRSIASLFGMDGIAHYILSLRFAAGSVPLDEPLWFMRDLFFLFLLSPILFRGAKVLFPVMLLLSVLPPTAAWFDFNAAIGLSPNSLAFFTCGCFLRRLPQTKQHSLLRFFSPWFLAGYILIAVAAYYAMFVAGIIPVYHEVGFVRGLVSIIFLHQVARGLERYVPKATPFALAFAPVTFLTFAGHLPIYNYLLPCSLRGTAWIALLPVVCFAFFSLLFFAMKRYARPLLHLVAHYKQRV